MSTIALLCTDFDGTLVDFSCDQCTPEFSEVLLSHRENGGAWAINTGRIFSHTLEGLVQFQAPIIPDYIITVERELYHLSSTGEWQDFGGDWNLLCRNRHGELLARFQAELKSICQQLSDQWGITLIYEDGMVAGFMASNEKMMDQITLELDWACKDFAEFSYQRNTVYLHFCHADYHKGSTLAELCRLSGISRETVFAAGDHFNDLSMLDGTHAAMCACPANAIEPVKQTVLKAGGFVASRNYASGVQEAIQYFWSL